MIIDPEPPSQSAEVILAAAAARRGAMQRRIVRIVAFGAVLIALALLWLDTPLHEWADVPRLVAAAHQLGDSPFAPLAVLAAFVAGGLVVAPVNILIGATMVVFGPLTGTCYALLGSLLNAWVLYEIGRVLPAARLRARLDRPLRLLTGRMSHQGILAIMLIRIVPVAPYSVVNLIAGAAHVARVPYLIGTALGMLPGIVLNALLIDRLIAALVHPGPWTWALLALVGAAIAGIVFAVHRRLRRAGADA
jgi:phospholipase D1/2